MAPYVHAYHYHYGLPMLCHHFVCLQRCGDIQSQDWHNAIHNVIQNICFWWRQHGMVTPRQHATVRHCRGTHKLTSRWHFHVPADRWYIWKHICDNECMNGSYPIQFPNSHARLQSGIFHPALNGQSSTTHQQHLHVQGCRQMMDYELGKTLVHAYNIFIYLFICNTASIVDLIRSTL